MKKNNSIIIIDFGSQYSRLIKKAVDSLGVNTAIIPFDKVDIYENNLNYCQGIILSGGPDSANCKFDLNLFLEKIIKLSVPILGICFGMQLLSLKFGGELKENYYSEFGKSNVILENESVLFDKIDEICKNELKVWMSHNDSVISINNDFKITGRTNKKTIAAFENTKMKIFGVQFHPEVSHTSFGLQILENFLYRICDLYKNKNLTKNYSDIKEQIIKNIKNDVGREKVVLALSGGVDSLVLSNILDLSISKNLICIFVNTGLLGENELTNINNIKKIYKRKKNFKLIKINATKIFFKELMGVTDPELKRKIIGKLFMKIFINTIKKIDKNSEVKWIAQGTIYSDVIESGNQMGGNKNVIKSHHNVGGLPKKIPYKILEPFRLMFKDQVRLLGLEIGMEENFIKKHPFPGPGYAIRIIGEIKKSYINCLRLADKILLEELNNFKLYSKIDQAFCIFIPIKSVSVKGDSRKYSNIICLRAIKSIDFMTADWYLFEKDFLSKVSNRIINEIPNISRVVYDISSKPPSTIEWE